MNSNIMNIPVPDSNDERLKYRFPSALSDDFEGIVPYYADSEGVKNCRADEKSNQSEEF